MSVKCHNWHSLVEFYISYVFNHEAILHASLSFVRKKKYSGYDPITHLNRMYFHCSANWNLLFFSNWIFLTSSWMEKPCTGRVPGDSAPSHLAVTNLSLPEFRWHAIFMRVFRSVFPLQLPALNSDGVDLDRPHYLADPPLPAATPKYPSGELTAEVTTS